MKYSCTFVIQKLVDMFNPFISIIHFLALAVCGRVHFPKEQIAICTDCNNTPYKSFRHIKIRQPKAEQPSVFRVEFTLSKEVGFRKNKILSCFIIPFFCGLDGFREKYWCVMESENRYMGLYEWRNHSAAERYANSYAVRFMTHRSVAGSISCHIIDNSIDDYIASQINKHGE